MPERIHDHPPHSFAPNECLRCGHELREHMHEALRRYLPFAPSLIETYGSADAADILAGTIASWWTAGAPTDPPVTPVTASAGPRLRRELAILAGVYHSAQHSAATEFLRCSAPACLRAQSALAAGSDQGDSWHEMPFGTGGAGTAISRHRIGSVKGCPCWSWT